MKNILITGGAGYIGSHTVKLFLENGYNVVVFDNLSRGFFQAIKILQDQKTKGKLEFVNGDTLDKTSMERVLNQYSFEGVIHFAAMLSVNESMENPGLYFTNNTVGSLNLIEALNKNNIKNFIFSSTCATYGNVENPPVKEDHQQSPTNPYGESKLFIEKILKWYGIIFNFKYIILRYFNVCGADKDGLIGDSKKPSPHLVQNAVRGAMNIEPFKFTCGQFPTPDGSSIRDYVDVEDMAKAHLLAYQYLVKNQRSDVFNLGNGKGWSVKEIIHEVEKLFQTKIIIHAGKIRQGEYAQIYADPSKAKRILGWSPEKTLTDSILSLKKWYEKHPHGYEN